MCKRQFMAASILVISNNNTAMDVALVMLMELELQYCRNSTNIHINGSIVVVDPVVIVVTIV